jgi:hypothetical protein
MTKEEWLSSAKVEEMLVLLGSSTSPRKLRLFLVKCAQRVLPSDPDNDMVQALGTAERFADGAASKAELTRARSALKTNHTARCAQNGVLYLDHIRSVPAWHAARDQMTRAGTEGSGCCAWSTVREPSENGSWFTLRSPTPELAEQATILRDIFGNPFRPVTFDPRWRTSDVVSLAQAIYDDKAFERMPILADALMDAGCEEEQIIGHCRGEGPHVRGCWVVDLVLAKQ